VTFWDKVRSLLKSEASDIGEELGKARDNFDAALTRKEEELAASPKERMDMILDDIGDSDAEFDRILDKAEGRGSMAAATSEVRASATGEEAQPDQEAPPRPVEPVDDTAASERAAVQDDLAAAVSTGETTPGAETTSTSETTSPGDETSTDAADVAAAERAAAAEAAAIERQRVIDARRAAADAKFAEQKAKADDLLDELRGELGIDE